MIGIERLSHSWGDFALRDVSLCVEPGEYFVILGPCGSGKTLLLEAVTGLYTPSAGRIVINGRDVTRLPPERRRVGLVYQQYALFPHLSVRENIAYGLRYLSLTRAERAEAFAYKQASWLSAMPAPTAATLCALAAQFARGGTDELESQYIWRTSEVRQAGGLSALRESGTPAELLYETKARVFAA